MNLLGRVRACVHKTLAAAMFGLAASTAAALAQADVPAAVVKDLAPNGHIRVAINAGNVVLVQRDQFGAPTGITVDLGQELGRRLHLRVEHVIFEAAGRVTDAVNSNAWDIAFVAIEPKRAEIIGFTAPYVIIEGTYMAAANSPLKQLADVDRDGIRIAVARGSAYDLFLSRTLKHATLVRYPSPPAALDGYLADRLDVAAGVKQQLVAFAKSHPDYRVMDGHFQEIREAMGVPLGHDAGLQYLKSFIEELKANGFVRAALDRAGQAEAIVAPPAK
jgi:polar amino acid transport system substrate-binding protein